MFRLLSLLFLIVGSTTTSRHFQSILKAEGTDSLETILQTFRLPDNTRPESYDVSLRTWIHQANFTFIGSVRIGILAVESTDFIMLHHRVQSIESITVLTSNQVPIDIGDYFYEREYETLTIPVREGGLTAGAKYFIEIDYVGAMNNFNGFYWSSYYNDGEQRWFGSTKFEPLDARSAFPCYDEPALKSTFAIQLTHDPSYLAISNMPAVSEFPSPNEDGSVTTTFESTPKISSYLIAFHVSDFSYGTNSLPQPVPQRIFSRSNIIDQTNLALETGELLLESFSNYFDVEYSLPKMDQVGIPGFPYGANALESWGLITYNEYSFFFDTTRAHFSQSVNAILTISHELSQQWFGNLVTPRWWTYLWMKEGFATLYEYMGVDLINPDWNMMDFFLVDISHFVLNLEANVFTQPLTYFVEHPHDIQDQFNSITSDKGGAVLRMFMYVFGEETFLRGVTSYLQANAYSDATEEDLFEALDAAIRTEEQNIIPPTVDVATIMSSWTRQAGFPLVTVERNYDNRTDEVVLRQQRYYVYPPGEPDDSSWWVPYNFATPRNPGFENTRAEGWIPENSFSINIVVDSLGADDYLLVNKRAAGYYRIMYDERNYRLISDAILRNNSLFHATNKAQLFNDAYTFIRSNQLTYTPLLDLMRILEFDSDYVSWRPIFSAILFINLNMRGHRNFPIWEDFIRTLTEHLYDTVGIEDIPNEPILRKYSRESVIQLACQMGSVHCRSDASRLLRQHIETGREFHQNIRNVVLCASLRSANPNDFHFMWNRMMSYPIYEYTPRSEIITSLGCSTSRQLLNEFLRSSLNSTNSNNVIYSPYELTSILSSIITNGGNVGLDLVLDFLIQNAVEAYETYGQYVVIEIANFVSRADHIERYGTFLNILLEEDLIRQDLIDYNNNRIAESLEWLDNHGEVINRWLMENYV